MPTESRSSKEQWVWFVLIWVAGVAAFGSVMFVLRALMGRFVGG